jgi:hypothetical protein
VRLAEARLVNLLEREGAEVYCVRLPDEPDGSKNGLDDYLVRYGADALAERLQAAEPQGRTAMRKRITELEEQQAAMVGALTNTALTASQRIVGALAIPEFVAKAERQGTDQGIRLTIDAPAHPDQPDNPERVGLASKVGFHRNTISAAIAAVFGEEAQGAPLRKHNVDEYDAGGRKRGEHLEFEARDCAVSVPGMLWKLARTRPAPAPEKPPRPAAPPEPRCATCPPGTPLVRTTVCRGCGSVLDERTTPNPPVHKNCAPVKPTGARARGGQHRNAAGGGGSRLPYLAAQSVCTGHSHELAQQVEEAPQAGDAQPAVPPLPRHPLCVLGGELHCDADPSGWSASERLEHYAATAAQP